MITAVVKTRAQALQRKGYTLTEIAEQLDRQRTYIVRILYWEKVCEK